MTLDPSRLGGKHLRLLVTGDRNFTAEAIVHGMISELDPDTAYVVLGDAKGADTIAYEACFRYFVPHTVHRANWARFGKVAGPMRNGDMIADWLQPDGNAHYVAVAFHDNLASSKGTRNCVSQVFAQAAERGMVVHVFLVNSAGDVQPLDAPKQRRWVDTQGNFYERP